MTEDTQKVIALSQLLKLTTLSENSYQRHTYVSESLDENIVGSVTDFINQLKKYFFTSCKVNII